MKASKVARVPPASIYFNAPSFAFFLSQFYHLSMCTLLIDEGNPPDYQDLLGDVLDRHGYDVLISGKTDWTTGGHSLNVRLNSWTMYTRFPYNVNTSGGWYDETDCPSNGTIANNQIFKRHEDWKTVDSSTKWIQDHAATQKADPINARPFFAYQGMNIVHPGYATNEFW